MGVRQLTGFERIESAILRYGPLAGLVIGTVITAATPGVIAPSWTFWGPTAAVVVAAAAWCYGLATRPVGRSTPSGDAAVWATRPRVGAVYLVGYVVLMAVLVHRSPWFAFLAVPGYANAVAYLHGRWRIVGMAAVAVLHAYAVVGGGLAPLTPEVVLGIGVIAVVIGAIAIGYSLLSVGQAEESQRRASIIEELHETNRRLGESLDENAVLHARLLAQARESGIVDERARLAREIHDTIAQGLTGIVTQLEAATTTDADTTRHIDTARALARESLTEARRSVEALTPGRLAEAHLPEAITDMAKAWAETSGVGVHVDTTGDPRPLLPDIEVALFRVAQEALANVGKHACATRVGLTLSYMDDVVVLDVRDDGRGFDPAARPAPSAGHGFGLAAMEQRVRRVSGTCEIESAPGDGTAISASVPALSPRPRPEEGP